MATGHRTRVGADLICVLDGPRPGVCLLDEEATAIYLSLKRRGWRFYFNKARGYVLARRMFRGRQRNSSLHRLLVGAKRGRYVDHKNRVTIDNRMSNLRTCNASENARNRKKAKVKYHALPKGVTPQTRCGKTRFLAHIRIGDGKRIQKHFHTEKAASTWYKAMTKKHHREFAS